MYISTREHVSTCVHKHKHAQHFSFQRELSELKVAAAMRDAAANKAAAAAAAASANVDKYGSIEGQRTSQRMCSDLPATTFIRNYLVLENAGTRLGLVHVFTLVGCA